MKTLGGLMDRFKHLKAPNRSVSKALVQAVNELVSIDVDASVFKISGESKVYLQARSAIKMAIFEQKQEVLSRANNILGKDQLKQLL